MHLNQLLNTPVLESQSYEIQLTIDGKPATTYQSMSDATRDLEMLRRKFPEKDIQLKTEKCVTQTVKNIPEQIKPKLIKLHYFNVDDTDAAKNMGMKQDRNGQWYLPQYSTSEAGFDRKYSSCRRTFGEVKRTAVVNENKKSETEKSSDEHIKSKKTTKDTDSYDEISDPEVRSVRQFAKSHYSGAKSEQEAFDKYVIHSLRHSEQDDNEQNRKLKAHAQQIQDLQDQIDSLKSITTKNAPPSAEILNPRLKQNTIIEPEKQIPVSEHIQKVMQDCIQILVEKQSTIHKHHKRAMPKTRNYPNMNSFYELYRFGIALATQPDEDSPTYGPVGSHPSTYAYTDGDSEKIKAAEKNMGKTGVFLDDGPNSEADDVYVTSPLPSKKSRKYK